MFKFHNKLNSNCQLIKVNKLSLLKVKKVLERILKFVTKKVDVLHLYNE